MKCEVGLTGRLNITTHLRSSHTHPHSRVDAGKSGATCQVPSELGQTSVLFPAKHFGRLLIELMSMPSPLFDPDYTSTRLTTHKWRLDLRPGQYLALSPLGKV